MTRKAVLSASLVLLLNLTASPNVRATEQDGPVMEEWTLNCMFGIREHGECGIYWMTRLTREQETSAVAVALGPDKAGYIFGIFAEDGLCDGPDSTMQIDGYGAEILGPTDKELYVPAAPVSEIIARLNTGTMMFLRLHLEPDCKLNELAIPLPGFADTHAQMPE